MGWACLKDSEEEEEFSALCCGVFFFLPVCPVAVHHSLRGAMLYVRESGGLEVKVGVLASTCCGRGCAEWRPAQFPGPLALLCLLLDEP